MALFKVEIKPTSHKQRCCVCKELMIKGKVRVAMTWNGFQQSDSLYAHPNCLINHIKQKCNQIEKENPYFIPSFNPSKRDENI